MFFYIYKDFFRKMNMLKKAVFKLPKFLYNIIVELSINEIYKRLDSNFTGARASKTYWFNFFFNYKFNIRRLTAAFYFL